MSASLSCCDLLHLADAIAEINASDIDFVHYDVVDGCFNNCFVFGDLMLEKLRPICEKPVEVHLAVEHVRPCLLYTSLSAHLGDIAKDTIVNLRKALDI